MKKVLILAVATVMFASCTKDYTCNCTEPVTQETNQMVFKTNKESHAKRLCDDWAIRVRTAITDKSAYDCKIQ